MADIFISYASGDRSRVEPLAKSLEDQGWSVWWDRIIPPGKTFDQVIQEEIAAAKCVVVVWSTKSIKSDWVKEEANIGKRRQILVPAKIDSVDPPLGFGLIQAADLTEWETETSHGGLSSLLSAISEIVGLSPLKAGEAEQKRTKEKNRSAILFHGHLRPKDRHKESSPEWEKAVQIAKYLGEKLLQNDYDVILYNSQGLDGEMGQTAVDTCQRLSIDPKTRITTYFSEPSGDRKGGFGNDLPRPKRKSRDFRTYLVDNCDAVITCAGGNGTSDLIQKARLAKKPVFPIAILGGTSEKQWRELKEEGIFYCESGELEILADHGASPQKIAMAVLKLCNTILKDSYSN